MTAPAETTQAWTAHRMRRALYRHFIDGWAPLFEISADATSAEPTVRRVDMLAVRRARKAGIGPLDLLAVEIKISRGDFLADVRIPEKQQRWREVAHRHAFAAPAGLIRKDEVPDGSGLIEVSDARSKYEGDRVAWVKQVPYTTTPDLPAWLTLTIAHRLARVEALTRGLSGDTADSDAAALRADVKRLRRELDNAERRGERYKREIETWKRAFAEANPVACGTCGEPIRPDWTTLGMGWKHRAKAADAPCEDRRIASLPSYEQERIEQYRAKHGRSAVYLIPPIGPVDEFGGPA